MSSTRFPLALSAFSLAVLLSACGGGGSGSSTPVLFKGQFIDAPVQNLQYRASPSGEAGTTDAYGTFFYRAGDTVAFTAAGLPLGSTAPVVGSGGAALVTPTSITGESNLASASTAPNAMGIARALNTLSAISTALGTSSSGTLVIPTPSIDTTHYSQLSAALSALGSASGLAAAPLQTALNGVYGSGTYAVVPDSAALASLQNAVSDAAFVSALWSGTVSNSATGAHSTWYLYVQPNQTVGGMTDGGEILSGSWSRNGSGSYAVTVSATYAGAASGTYSGSVTPASGSFSITGTNSASQAMSGGLGLSTASSTGSSNAFIGLWTMTGTPNNAGTVQGHSAKSAKIVVTPNGNLYAAGSDGSYFNGTIDLNAGSFSIIVPNSSNETLSLAFATGNGTDVFSGMSLYTITLSR